MLLRARGGHAVGIQPLRDATEPGARGDLPEDPPNHLGLLGHDLPEHVAALVAVPHLDVAIAVDEAARDVAALGLTPEGVARALAALLAVHLVHERHHGDLEPNPRPCPA